MRESESCDSEMRLPLYGRRPLHHNAHALRNVDYMVDEDELVRMSRSAPPCDGESDLGGRLSCAFYTSLSRQCCLLRRMLLRHA